MNALLNEKIGEYKTNKFIENDIKHMHNYKVL